MWLTKGDMIVVADSNLAKWMMSQRGKGTKTEKRNS